MQENLIVSNVSGLLIRQGNIWFSHSTSKRLPRTTKALPSLSFAASALKITKGKWLIYCWHCEALWFMKENRDGVTDREWASGRLSEGDGCCCCCVCAKLQAPTVWQATCGKVNCQRACLFFNYVNNYKTERRKKVVGREEEELRNDTTKRQQKIVVNTHAHTHTPTWTPTCMQCICKEN